MKALVAILRALAAFLLPYRVVRSRPLRAGIGLILVRTGKMR
jgi:hypothetical protein